MKDYLIEYLSENASIYIEKNCHVLASWKGFTGTAYNTDNNPFAGEQDFRQNGPFQVMVIESIQDLASNITMAHQTLNKLDEELAAIRDRGMPWRD